MQDFEYILNIGQLFGNAETAYTHLHDAIRMLFAPVIVNRYSTFVPASVPFWK